MRATEADMPDTLVYINDDSPGYGRRKYGKGFRYFDDKGEAIVDEKTIQRIEDLVIPPMWKDVWIAKKKNGHIQVTGRDDRRRKQYIYHPKWQEYSSQTKYDSLKEFGETLPKIRKEVEKCLRKRSWTKEKTVALAVKLLDTLYLRIGNEYYKEANETYGLTTLRRKHLRKENGCTILEYKAKSGKFHQLEIEDKKLAKNLLICSDLPGYELFSYLDGGVYTAIDSSDVNEFLRRVSGMDISAKNYRTWGGTVMAVEKAEEAWQICEESPRKKLKPTLIKLVAKYLNNTIAICEKYYIHPKVLEHVLAGEAFDFKTRQYARKKKWYSKSEIAVLNILNN